MAAEEALVGFTNIAGDIIGNNLQSAQYMLKFGDRLTSTIKGFEDYALVKKWTFGIEHYIQGYLPSQVHPRRPTTLSPLEVFLHHGDYIPKLMTDVSKQSVLGDEDTKLIVLTSAGDVNQKIFEIQLTNAVLESVQLSTEYFPFFRVLIRYKKVQVTAFNYDQASLSNQGQVAFSYDISTNVVS